MTWAIAAASVVAVVAGFLALSRWRSLRRDEKRVLSHLRGPDDIGHVQSVTASTSVRVLEHDAEPFTREEPQRPRLDEERTYVFTDGENPPAPTRRSSPSRHDEHWAIDRSTHHSRLTPGVGRSLIIAVIGLLLLLAIGAYVQSTEHTSPHSTTTTTHPAH